MRKFNIKLARIEAMSGSGSDPHVCITFRIERGAVKFEVPICLSMCYYDDTEMVEAARDILHRILVEAAAQTRPALPHCFSAHAVCILIDNSISVGCSTGMSAGLAASSNFFT